MIPTAHLFTIAFGFLVLSGAFGLAGIHNVLHKFVQAKKAHATVVQDVRNVDQDVASIRGAWTRFRSDEQVKDQVVVNQFKRIEKDINAANLAIEANREELDRHVAASAANIRASKARRRGR